MTRPRHGGRARLRRSLIIGFATLTFFSSAAWAQEAAVPGPSVAPATRRDVRSGLARTGEIVEPPPVRRSAERVRLKPDPAVGSTLAPHRAERPIDDGLAPAAPALTTNFLGIDFSGIFPPDAGIAAGPTVLVLVTNGALTIRDKQGFLITTETLRTFFAGLRQPTESAFDPRVVYDPNSGRFFVSAAGRITNASCKAGVDCVSHLFLAVSKTSSPVTTGSDDWFFYGFDATLDGTTPTANWIDFPTLGVDPSLVVIAAEMFSFSDGSFQYVKVRVLNKATLTAGGTVTPFDFFKLTDPQTGFTSITTPAAVTFGAPGTFFLMSSSRTFGSCNMIVRGIVNGTSAPTMTTGLAAAPGTCGDPPDAAQPPEAMPLDTGDNRLRNLVYRNGSLWAAQTVAKNFGSGTVAAIRWVQAEVSGGPTTPRILQDQTYGQDGVSFMYAAVAVDAANNVGLAFTRSSASEFPSAYYTARLAGDPPSTLQASALLKAGGSTYEKLDPNGTNRWGDYSAIAVDRVDGSFWAFAEYATGGATWGMWVGQFSLPTALVSAVLPSSRSVQVSTPATAFLTAINTGGATARAVSIGLATPIAANLTCRTTDPATNQPTGSPNIAVDIPAGVAQSFVVAVTPLAALDPTDVAFTIAGNGVVPPAVITGVNTLLLSASPTPVPDIVALGATAGNTGIVNIPGATGTGAFAVATVNVGASGLITVTADTGGASLPVSISLCQTNPTSGACLGAPTSAVTTQIDANATPTFAIFIKGLGTVVFDPAHNRIFVRFKDPAGVTRGATSEAVKTQ